MIAFAEGEMLGVAIAKASAKVRVQKVGVAIARFGGYAMGQSGMVVCQVVPVAGIVVVVVAVVHVPS